MIAAFIVGATYVITQDVRKRIADHEQRIAQLEKNPRFTSRTVNVDNIATTANSNRSIWTVDGTDTIYFAHLYVETFGTQVVNRSVALTPPAEARKAVLIDRGPAGTCTLTFWLEKNQIMLAPATCTGGVAEDHATIQAAVEMK